MFLGAFRGSQFCGESAKSVKSLTLESKAMGACSSGYFTFVYI